MPFVISKGKWIPHYCSRFEREIEKAPLDDTLAAGYLTPFLHGSGIFSGVGLTERPDTVCGKIEEGRVAILVNGTPNVLLVPFFIYRKFSKL